MDENRDDEELDVEVEDLAIDEIRELLFEAGAEISEEQAQQLAQFVGEAGGIEEALEVLSHLAQQHKAA
jgi:hypothetical protein